MKGLSHFVAETRTIPFGKGEYAVTVRGLTVPDLTDILGNYLGSVEELVELYEKTKSSIFARSTLDGFMLKMIRGFPAVTSEIISKVCIGEEGSPATLKERAEALPFPVQAAIMNEVITLTMEEAGGLKNLFATLGLVANELLPDGLRKALESRKKAQH